MDTAYDKGLATRKQVMGEDYVAKALDSATEFTLPIQEHITRAAWGDVWQREGLDRKTRSLVTVAMLTALGKQHELKGHVRGALNNGATAKEIQEVLLHATIYCGVPAAVDAFRTAAEVIDSKLSCHPGLDPGSTLARCFVKPRPSACAPGRRWCWTCTCA